MISIEDLQEKIGTEKVLEALNENIELKSSWQQTHGKTISAFANRENIDTSYIIIGISDDGKLIGHDQKWLLQTEHEVSNHINHYLYPFWTVQLIKGLEFSKGHCLVISIKGTGDITEWNGKAYKRIGANSTEMTPEEKLDLTLKLPGQDYSKQHWNGEISSSLVIEFAKKLIEKNSTSLPNDISNLSANDILKRINCADKVAANILFGNFPVRIAYYDKNNDVVEQSTKNGTFSLLTDDFIEHIQTWTKSKGTVLAKNSLATVDEKPYPLKALRECFANAVAHALYEKNQGEIVVEIYIDRLSIRNNCPLDVRQFSKEWFSKKTFTRNKFLMLLLREAGYTDELGSGKIRLFSQMLEAGKREPTIEFYDKGNFGCWSVILYNEMNNESYLTLLEKFKQTLPSIDEARLALALVLWRRKSWTEIQEKFDSHYKNVAKEIIQNQNSPIIVVGDSILTKRWVKVAMQGKDSSAFTTTEEEQIKDVIQKFAFSDNRNGKFDNEQARGLIGLSNTPSEVTQLSNLFRKWREINLLKQGTKRGEWIFLNSSQKQHEIIMSLLNEVQKVLKAKTNT